MTVTTKTFSIHEANKTLPLVRRIVKDILVAGRETQRIANEFQGESLENPALKRFADELKSFVSELEEIGCIYNDWTFRVGYVDFPSIIENREVFLCWKYDEEKIQFYREKEDDHSFKKRLPIEYL